MGTNPSGVAIVEVNVVLVVVESVSVVAVDVIVFVAVETTDNLETWV